MEKAYTLILLSSFIMIFSGCGGDNNPVSPTDENELSTVVEQKRDSVLKVANDLLPPNYVSSLSEEIANISQSNKESFLDTLGKSLNGLSDTLKKYHSLSAFKDEIQRVQKEAQKLTKKKNISKGKILRTLGLGYGKGLSVELGGEGNIGIGISKGLSAQGGGGAEVLYDMVNMDREVYVFTACGIGVDIGLGLGASLSGNAGVAGFNKWLLNIKPEKQENKFKGPAKATSFGLSGSGFFGIVGLDASISIGKAQDVEGDASFYNLSECPYYFAAPPTPEGIKEVFMEVSVGGSKGIGAELIASLKAGQIGTNRTAVPLSYSDFENKFNSRRLSSFKMSAELLTPNPFNSVSAGLPSGSDLVASVLAITYGNIKLSEFEQDEPVLSYNPNIFNVDSDKGTVYLSIENIGTGNIEWEVSSDSDWLSFNPTSGNDNSNIEISYEKNTTGILRSADIFIYSNGGNSDPIDFIQSKKEVSSNSLIASYPFNGSANDESGNGNDGTVDGATLTTDRFGNTSSAYSFDGTDDLIYGDFNWGQATSQSTLSFWFKTTNSDNLSALVGLGNSTNDHEVNGEVNKNIQGNVQFYVREREDVKRDAIYTNDSFTDGEWHHAVLVRNGSGADNLSIYIDNKLVNNITIQKDENVGDIFFDYFYMGAIYRGEGNTINRYFEGNLDDVRIYNYAISESEISALYFDGGYEPPSDSDPLAYYPFNGNAEDESGNNFDGTIYSADLTEDRFGNVNKAYSFDGIDDYINLNSLVDELKTTSEGTFSGWFKVDELNTVPEESHTIFHFSHLENEYGVRAFRIFTDYDSLGVYVRDYSINSTYPYMVWRFYLNKKIETDTWYHFVVKYDGSEPSAYLNGEKTSLYFYDEFNKKVWFNNMSKKLNQIDLGVYNANGRGDMNRVFHGELDDIRIYDRALSDSEISDLFNE